MANADRLWRRFLLLAGIVVTAAEAIGRRASHSRGEICRQWIQSDVSSSGNFTSPNYPESYPPEIKCIYEFTGKPDERVQILFTDFELFFQTDESRPNNMDNCDNVDVVKVFIKIGGQKERVANFCGNKLPAQLMSNSPTMTIEFQSRTLHSASTVHHTTPNPIRGFRAIYRFVTNYGINTGEQDIDEGCSFIFNSTGRSNGTFMSPNYPGLYPRDTTCHYFFIGRTFERVHVTFAYFDVDGIPPCESATASDFVEFSNFRTIDRKLQRHCGTKIPKKLESDGDFFRVTFKSNDKFDGTGFEAFFQFRSTQDLNSVKRHVGAQASTITWRKELAILHWAIYLILATAT